MTLLERRRAMMSRKAEEGWTVLLPANGATQGFIATRILHLQAGQTLNIQWARTTVGGNANYIYSCGLAAAVTPYYKLASGTMSGECSVHLNAGYSNISIGIAGTAQTADGTVNENYNFYGNYIKYRIT